VEIEIGRLEGLAASSSYSAITLAFAKIIVMDWNQDVQCYLDVVLHSGIPDKDRPKQCPHCGQSHQLLHQHGHFNRKVFTLENESIIPIYRFYCPLPQCKKTMSLIPTFVQKHQQVALDIQEQVIQAQDEGVTLLDLAKKTESVSGGAYSEKALWRWTTTWRNRLSRGESQIWEWMLRRLPHLVLPQGRVFSRWGWFIQGWKQVQEHLPEWRNFSFLHGLHCFLQARR
jgi:hypothetical protein